MGVPTTALTLLIHVNPGCGTLARRFHRTVCVK